MTVQAATTHHTRPGYSTVSARERLVTPDVARGIALLSILIANLTATWLVPDDPAASYADFGGVFNDSAADTWAIVFSVFFNHVRGLPMFSTLLGYGFAMLVWSLHRRAYPVSPARRVLVRRYGILAIFGMLHTIFFFAGDIMFFYGIAGMLLATMITWRDKWLLIVAGISYVVSVLSMGSFAYFTDTEYISETANSKLSGLMGAETYGQYFFDNVLAFIGVLTMIPMELLMLFPVILVGFVAGRHRILTRAEEHKTLLIWTCVIGNLIGLATAIPQSLAVLSGASEGDAVFWYGLNAATGVATGPAILAFIALACIPLQRRISARRTAESDGVPGWILPVVALGRRSMSGYLAQSLICVWLVTGFGLGFGRNEGAFFSTVLAFFIWGVTLLGAWLLEKKNLPGPFEWLHRRLSYGEHGLYDQYPQPQPQMAYPYGVQPAQLPQQPVQGFPGQYPAPVDQWQPTPTAPDSDQLWASAPPQGTHPHNPYPVHQQPSGNSSFGQAPDWGRPQAPTNQQPPQFPQN